MGGFVIRRDSPGRLVTTTFPETGTVLTEPGPPDAHEQNPSTAELDPSANASPQPASPQPVLIHLLTHDIVLLRSKGLLPKLPYITLEEINDKSKSDSLVRVITVVQIIWMLIQVIARAFRSLAISQLEVSVVAFAVCAVMLYGINWEKPKGVQVPITIISYPGPFPQDTMDIAERDRDRADNIFDLVIGAIEFVGKSVALLGEAVGGSWSLDLVMVIGAIKFVRKSVALLGETADTWPLGNPIPNVYNRDVPWINWTMLGGELRVSKSDIFGLFLGTTVFGAVHIAAWNFDFPTPVESLMWKITAVLCTTIILVFVCFVLVIDVLFKMELSGMVKFMAGLAAGITMLSIPVIYVVCRLFLVVEVFRCLCFLPPSAYVATWAANVPHVA
jgi:hypothetical protein